MGESPSGENAYLDQVLRQQVQVNEELKKKVAAPAPGSPHRARRGEGAPEGGPDGGGGRAVDWRVTGWWLWKTVVVPPNVYVVHTRQGQPEPIHVGLGVSFRFDPRRDAFLVIPAAMQTIVINANCICLERQGILVQAYVQWIIDDIRTAYRRLDFSDAEDPMRIVNVQLREQAEAAIKDKVATMAIDEVLADKQPIIEELTHRLRGVAEGSREGSDAGLGLKIVTVQIKEAVVSSTRVWENLQKPFRAERAKLARVAELQAEREIAARELENRRAADVSQLEATEAVEKLRAENEREVFDRALAERIRRHTLEQESSQRALAEENATEKARREAQQALALTEIGLERARLDAEVPLVAHQLRKDAAEQERRRAASQAEIALAEERSVAGEAISTREIELSKRRRAIDNELSEGNLRAQLINRLPEIASHLPVPQELRAVAISGDANGVNPMASLTALLTSALGVLEAQTRKND